MTQCGCGSPQQGGARQPLGHGAPVSHRTRPCGRDRRCIIGVPTAPPPFAGCGARDPRLFTAPASEGRRCGAPLTVSTCATQPRGCGGWAPNPGGWGGGDGVQGAGVLVVRRGPVGGGCAVSPLAAPPAAAAAAPPRRSSGAALISLPARPCSGGRLSSRTEVEAGVHRDDDCSSTHWQVLQQRAGHGPKD